LAECAEFIIGAHSPDPAAVPPYGAAINRLKAFTDM
jgi:hypothetical protein